VVTANTTCKLALNIWEYLVWNLLHITLLALRILRRSLDIFLGKFVHPKFTLSRHYITRVYTHKTVRFSYMFP